MGKVLIPSSSSGMILGLTVGTSLLITQLPGCSKGGSVLGGLAQSTEGFSNSSNDFVDSEFLVDESFSTYSSQTEFSYN